MDIDVFLINKKLNKKSNNKKKKKKHGIKEQWSTDTVAQPTARDSVHVPRTGL